MSSTEKNRVVVIGAGLGGLQCAYILAKKGMDVCVLEKSKETGGSLQSYRRGGAVLDTGMHYVGSLGEGEALNCLFRYFRLMDLPWVEMDRSCYDEVIIGDESFPMANGHDDFVYRLADRFPKSESSLKEYARMLKSTGDAIFDGLVPGRTADLEKSMFGMNAWDYLQETLVNPLLIKVVSGTSMKMELKKKTLPLYTFAQINDSFIRSAWRLRGGGSKMTDALRYSIEGMGGRVIVDTAVTGILEDEKGVCGVRVKDGSVFPADYVISSLHPALTVGLTSSEGHMRKSFCSRITGLENTYGMFTASIRLKPGSFRYLGRNIYMYQGKGDPWDLKVNDNASVMISFSAPDSGDFAPSADVLSPMSWDEVSMWSDRPVGRRGEEYSDLKKRKYWQCLQMVERRFPEIWETIDKVYTSTPATWNSYIGAPQGCAYGVRKDFSRPYNTVLSPLTPVPGLLMTGQSLNLHGVLGVSMTSLHTCSAVLGRDTVYEEIKPYINLMKK